MASAGWRRRAPGVLGWLLATPLAFLPACKSKTIQIDSDQTASRVAVSAERDLDAGVDGRLDQFMGTAFQPAIWQSGFFDTHPDEADRDASALTALGPPHVLVQVEDPPWKINAAGKPDWDFAELDAILGPLLRMGMNPLVQINEDPNNLKFSALNGAFPGTFDQYCAGLVRYYNGAGVTLTDGRVARSDAGKVAWWGIWSDPNTTAPPNVNTFNGLVRGADYAAFYDSVSRAMRAEDPTIHFAAPEYNDCTDKSDPCRQNGPTFLDFIPDFLAATADGGAGGEPAPLDVLSIHMFATAFAIRPGPGADVPWSDSRVFEQVPRFAQDIQTFRQALRDANRPDVSIWVTENQINSDVPQQDGASAHATSQSDMLPPDADLTFQADARGTSPFFAAWRPYLFSRLGKAGNQGLFQWEFTAGSCPDDAGSACSHLASSDTDLQNAEVDYSHDTKYLSYWVDYWLAHEFPPGGQILQVDSPDSAVEVLATKSTGSSGTRVVVMIVNLSGDANVLNGPGISKTVIVDLSPLLATTSAPPAASVLMIGAETDRDAGPAESAVDPQQIQNGWVPLSFDGYGVAFVTLDWSSSP